MNIFMHTASGDL